jgi:hypothetical protein
MSTGSKGTGTGVVVTRGGTDCVRLNRSTLSSSRARIPPVGSFAAQKCLIQANLDEEFNALVLAPRSRVLATPTVSSRDCESWTPH